MKYVGSYSSQSTVPSTRRSVWDPMRVFYVNEAACRSLGYSRQELLSMTVHDIDPDFPEDAWPAHWEQVKRRGNFMVESRHRAKDGRTLPVEVTVNYMEFNGKEYNCAFARDITTKKRAEQELRKSEQAKSLILENACELISYQDTDLRVVWVNKAAEESEGAEPESLVGRYCYEIWQQREQPCEGCPVAEAIRTGTFHESEMTTRDGRVWLVRGSPVRDETGKVIGVVETTLEISARKQVEEALRRSEQKFRTIVESVTCRDAHVRACDRRQADFQRGESGCR